MAYFPDWMETLMLSFRLIIFVELQARAVDH